MSNQETTAVATAQETGVGFSKGTLFIPNTDALGRLEEAETGMEVTVKYRTQEEWNDYKGKPVRAYFMGIKEIPNDQGEVVKCGAFFSQQGPFLAAQMMLVDAVQNLPMNTPVEITYQGKKANASSKGATNIFSVKTLVIPVQPKQVEAPATEPEAKPNGRKGGAK